MNHSEAFALSVPTDIFMLAEMIDQEPSVTFITSQFKAEVAAIAEDGISLFEGAISVSIFVETATGYKPMRVRVAKARPTYVWQGPTLTGQDSALDGRRLTHRFGPRPVEPAVTVKTRARRTPPATVVYFAGTDEYRHLAA